MFADAKMVKSAVTIQCAWRRKSAKKELIRRRRLANIAKTHANSDWIATIDEASGAEFYYNTKTKEMTWDKPAGFIEGVSNV